MGIIKLREIPRCTMKGKLNTAALIRAERREEEEEGEGEGV